MDNYENSVSVSTGKKNKVINVTLWGGLIGLLSSSPKSRLNAVIQDENKAGWRAVQIIPSSSGNILLFIFRFLLLFITFFSFYDFQWILCAVGKRQLEWVNSNCIS